MVKPTYIQLLLVLNLSLHFLKSENDIIETNYTKDGWKKIGTIQTLS